MATKKELYQQPIRGYWENKKSHDIYLIYQGHYDENTFKERIFWNAGAINLRSGKSRLFKLVDFTGLKKLDSETTNMLELNIHINHFIESWRMQKTQVKYSRGPVPSAGSIEFS